MYPSGELACQVLGFVGVDGEGLAGIEKRYDTVLAGKPGVLLGERDPYGRPIPGGVQKNIDAVDGHDIVLTIDKDIQYHAQLELTKAVKKWGAKGGSVVVMNPQNGEIYAMASTPGFNPNDFSDAKPAAFRNRPDLRRLRAGLDHQVPDGGGGHRQGHLQALHQVRLAVGAARGGEDHPRVARTRRGELVAREDPRRTPPTSARSRWG